MLKDILDKKKCFKLVCGCGNEDEGNKYDKSLDTGGVHG